LSFWQQETAKKGLFTPKMAAATPTVCHDAVRERLSFQPKSMPFFGQKGEPVPSPLQKRLLQCHAMPPVHHCDAVKETHLLQPQVFSIFGKQAISSCAASMAWQSGAIATAFPFLHDMPCVMLPTTSPPASAAAAACLLNI